MEQKNLELVKEIMQAYSPSGNEYDLRDTVLAEINRLKNVELFMLDKMGNVAFRIGSKIEKPKNIVLISAHIDQISLRVQSIDEDGFVHFIPNGGINAKTLLGTTLIAINGGEPTYGVIGYTPEMFGNEKEAEEIKFSDLKIDFGFTSKEDAENHLSIGDCICFDNKFRMLQNDRFSCCGIDDKAGVLAVIKIAEYLALNPIIEEINNNGAEVYVAGITQEETSEMGAVEVSKAINPTISIDFDVTFATDDNTMKKEEWGDIKLGEGFAICHTVDNDNEMTIVLKKICKEKKYKFQEFSKESGGTNTTFIKQSSSNYCRTMFLAIPCRNMHSQVEVCDWKDIESSVIPTVELIKEIAR